MRTALLTSAFAAFLSVSAGVAIAEPTQRQRHLPYVRAASDCIANAVHRDYEFANAVSSDNFSDLIGRGIKACTGPLTAMVTSHDQIYGGGGLDFLKVDYFADLERAVRTRLQKPIADMRTDLARRAEQQAAADAKARAERIEAENRRKAAQAEKLELAKQAQALLRDRMFDCIGREGASMLLTSEKAEAVAKAAMIFCRADVDAATRATVEMIEADDVAVSDKAAIRDRAERSVLEVATAFMIKARGELLAKGMKGQAGTEQAASPPPSQRSF